MSRSFYYQKVKKYLRKLNLNPQIKRWNERGSSTQYWKERHDQFKPLYSIKKIISKNNKVEKKIAKKQAKAENIIKKMSKLYPFQEYQIELNNRIYELQWNGFYEEPDMNYNGKLEILKSIGKPPIEAITSGLIDRFKSDSYPLYVKYDNKYYGPEEYPDDNLYLLTDEITELLDITISKLANENTPSIGDIPLFKSSLDHGIDDEYNRCTQLLNEVMLGKSIEYTCENLCTVEAIYYTINESSKRGLQNYSLDLILTQFSEIKNVSKSELQNVGITANNMLEWVQTYSNNYMSLYILDPADNLFIEHKASNQRYVFVGKANNDHLYVVTDPIIKRQIVTSGKISKKSINETVQCKKSLTYCNDISKLGETIYNCKGTNINTIIVKEQYKEVLNQYVKQTNNNITDINISTNQVTAFRCDDSKLRILIRDDCEQMMSLYDQLNNYKQLYPDIQIPNRELEYRGQTLPQICNMLIKYIVGDIQASSYNKRVHDYIESFQYPKLVETYDYDKEHVNIDNCKAIDITKAHSYAKINNLGDYPIFTINDKPEPYDNGPIKIGLYRVKPFYMFRKYKNKAIYIPENFYTHGFVKKCLAEGIITKNDIIEQYLSKGGYKKDLLKQLTEFTFKVFDIKTAKLISNMCTGLLGVNYKKSCVGKLCNSPDMVLSMQKEGYKSITINENLKLLRKNTETPMLNHKRVMWRSIIESHAFHLYEIINKHTNKHTVIHGIKSDAVYGSNFNKIITKNTNDILKKIGDVHEIPYTQLNDLPVYEKTHRIDRYLPKSWIKSEIDKNDYIQYVNQSNVFSGIGGSGKSYTIKKMIEHMDEKRTMVITPTNKACDALRQKQVKCATIDSTLYVTVDGKRLERYKHSKYFNYDHVIVDECYYMTNEQLTILYNIFIKWPDTKFHFYGDPKQCKPPEVVEKESNSMGIVFDYDKSEAFIDMTDQNMINITYNPDVGRYDDDLYQEVLKLDNNIVPNIQLFKGQKDVKRFLAKTNRTVDTVNKLIMDKKNSGDLFTLPKDKPNTKCKLTEMKLETGDVLLPSKSFKSLEIYKNQICTYKCKSDNDVTITLNDIDHIIPLRDFCNNFVPAFCMTIDKSQGSGIDEKYAILEANKLKKNDFNTAITRSTKYSNVYIDRKPMTVKQYQYTDYVQLVPKKIGVHGIIYKISREGDDKVFIGQTNKSIDEQLQYHLQSKKNDLFHNAIKNSNKDSWKIEAIEDDLFENNQQLCELEKHYINQHAPNVYNDVKITPERVIKTPKKIRLKGITERKGGYRVKITGKKEKFFGYKRCGKEVAYNNAKKYLMGL